MMSESRATKLKNETDYAKRIYSEPVIINYLYTTKFISFV